MLVVVQFPILDLRAFLPVPTGRLLKPIFPVTNTPQGKGREEFIRGVGPLRSRRSGTLQD